jgi:hypothetical protein
MGWRDVLAGAGVRVNEDGSGWDPDTVYATAYAKGRRDEAAARDLDGMAVDDDADEDSAGWPDAARWRPGGAG